MKSFALFLSEENKIMQLPEPDHVEDLVYYGHEGVGMAADFINSFSNKLLGMKRNVPERIDKKMDTEHHFHIAKDKEGRIAVSDDTYFDKKPNIFYTDSDVDTVHKDNPVKAQVLKQILAHSYKMTTTDMRPGDVIRGSYLFGKEGEYKPTTKSGFVEISPNFLKYKMPKGSAEATKIQNAKVGVVLNSYFGKNKIPEPFDNKKRAKVMDHPDVFNFNPELSVNPLNYSADDHIGFQDHMENATMSYNKIKPEVYDQLVGHDNHLKEFSNQRARTDYDSPAKINEYLVYLKKTAANEMAKSTSDKEKEKTNKKYAKLIDQAFDNKKNIENIFGLHHHLQQAKNILVNSAHKNSREMVEMPDGEPTTHEGYVVMKDKRRVKFYDRTVFPDVS